MVLYVHLFSLPRKTNLIRPIKYNFCSVYGPAFEEDQFKLLTDSIPCRDEIIPDPDSTPLSVLNHPLGKRHEIDTAAYDPPEVALSPVLEGAHPGLVILFRLFV